MQMVFQKYYSFEKPSNRRKHKPVLHNRTNSDGFIDLTVGGPLNYEEMWELEGRHGHTLSQYFMMRPISINGHIGVIL